MLIFGKIYIILSLINYVISLPPKSPAFIRDEFDRKHFLVQDLPGMTTNIKSEDLPLMFAGQIELYSETNMGYFYWKFQDRKKLPENNKRTTFWLNGGPGCSSMDGALLESGPFRVNKDREIVYNKGSWHKLTDMVFVDQPAGTGFSYTDEYRHDLDQIAQDFLVFLKKYFEIFPEDLQNDIYLSGESYAGQYIPYIAQAILNFNKDQQNQQNNQKYNLKGLLIGNGWISPNEQSLSDAQFAINAKLVSPSDKVWPKLAAEIEECQKIVNQVDSTFNDGEIHDYEISSDVCERILTTILSSSRDPSKPNNEQCINMYDYTLRDTYPQCGSNWPNELAYVSPFLNSEQVVKNLNLNFVKKWVECSGRVGRNFNARKSLPAIHLLPELTKEMPVVLFHGNLDIICNYIGAEAMIKKLTWGGKRGFSEDIAADDWIYNNETVGYIKSERNLTFINVFNASHMVPYDKPEVSRALIDLITKNYDEKEGVNVNEIPNKKIITYPIGERKANLENPEDASKPSNENETENQDDNKQAGSSSNSRISRLIQFLVIAILIWGVYVIYVSYRYKSRPVSIIKARTTTTGKKKNVQWADQLRRFQEDDEEFQQQQNVKQSFLSKTIGKLTGNTPNPYSPVPYEEFELNEQESQSTPSADDFKIDSDDEIESKPLPPTPKDDENNV